MLAPIPPPTAAAPLLFLALQKIARTPTPRLEVGYRLVDSSLCLQRLGGPPPFAACERIVARDQRPLGQALFLDRVLAGGIVGEFLPMHRFCPADVLPLANLCIDAGVHLPPGQLFDVKA
jgi:hypothetical protein